MQLVVDELAVVQVVQGLRAFVAVSDLADVTVAVAALAWDLFRRFQNMTC
jgi:hypothetical protein